VRGLVTIVVGVLISSVLAMRMTRGLGLEKWHMSLTLLTVAGFLYGCTRVLIRYFIAKRAPQFASEEEVMPIVQLWELTTGVDIVPKWVSVMRLISISVAITAILPWVVGLLRGVVELLN
jgi:uncharacterized membrane protein YjjP (DUF1212 family)